MKSDAKTPDEYIAELPDERKSAMTKLRETILQNLPEGFVEEMNYGMIGYVVPHSIYPKGYGANPKLPLGMLNIASQKNDITMHHMGLYSDKKLLEWFESEYPKHSKTKLDMGKGCVHFKKTENIPFDLIAELVKKISVADWIETYEERHVKKS